LLVENPMTNAGHDGHLGAVYNATNQQEVADQYDRWASTYDADMSIAGYRHPAICLALLARHLPAGETPILDAGAGTGLMGEWMGILGYPHAEALDISQSMLAVAKAKGVYQAYHQLALGGPLPFADDAYAGITATGVFTTGHVGAEGLDELVRVCRPGGVIVLTVKETLWSGGFADYLNGLQSAGQVVLIEQTRPYVSMPGEQGTIPSRAIVIKAQ
jgi:ubiquinone/menaquinone biosynthesis C-methylase UbiE